MADNLYRFRRVKVGESGQRLRIPVEDVEPRSAENFLRTWFYWLVAASCLAIFAAAFLI